MTKVLYVDDDDDIREIATMSLELEPSFEVRCSSSGAQALQIVADWLPDIILLDVMMPRMDGPETLTRLDEMLGESRPPVLFCTARAQARDYDAYLALGAVGVIAKPFDPLGLAHLVKGHLD